MEEKSKILNGGDVLINCLLREDINYLFGVPGGQILNMYDAVYKWGKEQGIQTILFRHESAAAHAADALARVTNKPGVCFGTVGPGANNLVPGVAASWADNIPVIAIVPQVNTKIQDLFTLQGNLDQITMFKPITKYQKSIRKIEDIPDAVQKVFREATGGRPQPTLLEIFEDAFLETIEEEKIRFFEINRYRALQKPSISRDLVKRSLELLLEAKNPIIISGGGVSRSEAWAELEEFAKYLQIPVMTTVMGIGTISNKSGCLIGATAAGPCMKAANDADVILALGCKFSFTLGHGAEPFWNPTQKMIQVDIDPSIIGRAKPITLGIVGDCREFLKLALEEVKNHKEVEGSKWLEILTTLRQKTVQDVIKKGSRDNVPITPVRLVKDILESIDEDAILILDGGDIAIEAIEQIDFYKSRPPLSTLQSVCMGQLGTSVPYGIGAKLAKPDKQVVSISGDGSFMINIQDLETAVRLGLKNLIYVVGNNSAWGMIKSGQKIFMGKRYIDTEFPDFNFAKCAEGFECYGEVVSEPTELKPAFERAKNSRKPAILDVKIGFGTPMGTKLMATMGIL
ncbi:MAG: thiamine pyrophosphate-binding protein [Promethearchaeota archaeon]